MLIQGVEDNLGLDCMACSEWGGNSLVDLAGFHRVDGMRITAGFTENRWSGTVITGWPGIDGWQVAPYAGRKPRSGSQQASWASLTLPLDELALKPAGGSAFLIPGYDKVARRMDILAAISSIFVL